MHLRAAITLQHTIYHIKNMEYSSTKITKVFITNIVLKDLSKIPTHKCLNVVNEQHQLFGNTHSRNIDLFSITRKPS